jgi:hypothetical protein
MRLALVAVLSLAAASAAADPTCKTEYLQKDANTGFAIGKCDHGRTICVYRLEHCGKPVATIRTEGPLAFANMGKLENEMPTISIETWLMHGDRRLRRYVWTGKTYLQKGQDQEIMGPRRKPRR